MAAQESTPDRGPTGRDAAKGAEVFSVPIVTLLLPTASKLQLPLMLQHCADDLE